MGEKLSVFLSSVINSRAAAFRTFVKRALEDTKIAEVWCFEDEPADPNLKGSYARKVIQCDVLILLIWDDITAPVRDEYDLAVANGKPILMHRIAGESPNQQLDNFLKEVFDHLKWVECAAADLPSTVVKSFLNWVSITCQKSIGETTFGKESAITSSQNSTKRGVDNTDRRASVLAARVVRGQILKAIPFADEFDGKSRIAVLAAPRETSAYTTFLLEEFAGGYRIEWKSHPLAHLSWADLSPWFGAEDIDSDRRREVFYAEGSHGTGSGYDSYFVYVPNRRQELGVTIRETRDPYFRSWVDPCKEFEDKVYKRYLAGIEMRMKELRVNCGLGNLDEPPEVVWYRENGFLKTGYLILRRHKGPPRYGASVLAVHQDGNIEWRAYFKGPVIGYDRDNDEHFVVYGPETMYNWPTCFASNPTFLWFGTRGDGVFQYHKTLGYLDQMPANLPKRPSTVSSLEVKGGKLLVNGQIGFNVPWGTK